MMNRNNSYGPKEAHQVKQPGKLFKQQTGSWIRCDRKRQLNEVLDDVLGTWFLPMIILVHGIQISSLLNQNEITNIENVMDNQW